MNNRLIEGEAKRICVLWAAGQRVAEIARLTRRSTKTVRLVLGEAGFVLPRGRRRERVEAIVADNREGFWGDDS